MPIASIVFLVETTTRARGGFAFHGLFYGLRNFRCKTAHFCATRRESETTETPGVSNAAQASKNARNQLLYQLSYAGILRAETLPSAAISVLTVYAIFYGMPVGAMSTGQRAKRN